MPYTVRATIGKNKGQFIKKCVKDKIQAAVAGANGKQGRRRLLKHEATKSEVSMES